MKKFLLALSLFGALYLQAGEYDFDMSEIEVKAHEYSGFLKSEYKYQHLNNSFDTQNTTQNEVLLNFSYIKDIYKLNSSFSARYDNKGGNEDKEFTVYDLYLNIKPSNNHSLDIGKKSLKWGKGYFFNPAAFFDRKKDPTEPENAKEGYILANYKYNKSFQSDLKNIMLDIVYLPTTNDLNKDFYAGDSDNLAMKLYMLLYDTDIELIYALFDKENDKIGATFSKNLEPHFEVHGEFAKEISGSHSYLLGLKYVTKNDITITSEYLYQSDGLTKDEIATSSNIEPFIAKSYLINKLSIKEPFDTVYASAYFKDMLNLEDKSHLDSIGFTYDFKNNFEIDVSYNHNTGSSTSEFGKKKVDNFLWVKGVWYF